MSSGTAFRGVLDARYFVDDGAMVINTPPSRIDDQPATKHPAASTAPPTKTPGPTGSGSHDTGHPAVSVRRLTPRERERLQGFPDDWTTLDAAGRAVAARYRAMGNAVAVPGSGWIGRRLLAVAHTRAVAAIHPGSRDGGLAPTLQATANANADAVEVPGA